MTQAAAWVAYRATHGADDVAVRDSLHAIHARAPARALDDTVAGGGVAQRGAGGHVATPQGSPPP